MKEGVPATNGMQGLPPDSYVENLIRLTTDKMREASLFHRIPLLPHDEEKWPESRLGRSGKEVAGE
ncbi:MAG: hypothetical protein IJR87_04170 [Bacteroidaceae bacterium]|nr:hypothetical protein [Bacteroidaceae bacterium]